MAAVRKIVTWAELDRRIPDCTLGRLMDYVGEDTGHWPDWNDPVPSWVLDLI